MVNTHKSVRTQNLGAAGTVHVDCAEDVCGQRLRRDTPPFRKQLKLFFECFCMLRHSVMFLCRIQRTGLGLKIIYKKLIPPLMHEKQYWYTLYFITPSFVAWTRRTPGRLFNFLHFYITVLKPYRLADDPGCTRGISLQLLLSLFWYNYEQSFMRQMDMAYRG